MLTTNNAPIYQSPVLFGTRHRPTIAADLCPTLTLLANPNRYVRPTPPSTTRRPHQEGAPPC